MKNTHSDQKVNSYNTAMYVDKIELPDEFLKPEVIVK